MPNTTAHCPLCNFEVALSSNHPHSYRCPNLHRPYSQWLTTEAGYPSEPHPDTVPPAVAEEEDDTQGRAASDIAYEESDDLSPPIPEIGSEEPDLDTSTPEFGGGGDFGGGGGGSSW